MTQKTPILILSDDPSASSGLGRICRDLALGIHHNLQDIFEVATFGYGGCGDKTLPFFQYKIEGMNEWFLPTLRDVWENFSQGRKGVLLVIWDAYRTLWLSRPDQPIWSPDREMRKWLLNKPFEKWIYAPIDACGPNGKLSAPNAKSIMGYDRVIAYSEWAKGMLVETFGEQECSRRELVAIPHGIHTNVFHPRQEKGTRAVFRNELGFNGPVFEDFEKIIGIVATNQSRKDFGLAFAALAEVARDVPIRIFIQTDMLERHWALATLYEDFGLLYRGITNMSVVPDEVMSKIYAGCDLTLGIGPEGFGYPIFESLACGTPVIAGSYGGHAEHMDSDSLLQPDMFRLEGTQNTVRPVYDPKKWAWKIKKALTREEKPSNRFQLQKSLLPPRLDWKNLWAAEWEPHLRKLHGKLAHPEPIPAPPNNILEIGTAPEAHHT